MTRSNGSPITRPLDMEVAKTLIIERARGLVREAISERGHASPPFVPAEFARLCGVTAMRKAKLGETSGILLKLYDGKVITLNEDHSPVKQTFTCAHEIGHILFDELKLERYVQTIEYRGFNPGREKEREIRAAARERLCDIAATELLMPDDAFGSALSSAGVSVLSIESLAKTFGVSRIAAAIRIAEVSAVPCLTLLWNPSPARSPRELHLAWRVGHGKGPNEKNDYMPTNMSAKPKSPFFEAYETEHVTRAYRDFSIANSVERLPVESKGFGSKQQRYVISLAFSR